MKELRPSRERSQSVHAYSHLICRYYAEELSGELCDPFKLLDRDEEDPTREIESHAHVVAYLSGFVMSFRLVDANSQ